MAVLTAVDYDALVRQVLQEFGGHVRGDGQGQEQQARRLGALVPPEYLQAELLKLRIAYMRAVEQDDKGNARSRLTLEDRINGLRNNPAPPYSGSGRGCGMTPPASPKPESVPVVETKTPGDPGLTNVGRAVVDAQKGVIAKSAPPVVFSPGPDDEPSPAPAGGELAKSPTPPAPQRTRPASPVVASPALQGIRELRMQWLGLDEPVQLPDKIKLEAELSPGDNRKLAASAKRVADKYAAEASRILIDAGEAAAEKAKRSAAADAEAARRLAIAADQETVGASTVEELPPDMLAKYYKRR